MPRDSSGNYTLPLGNPVVDGTIIDVNWANPTMSDIAVQLNNVFTRDGLLGPTAAFSVVDGTAAAPGLSFTGQTNLGFFRPATNVLAFSAAGVERARMDSAAFTFTVPPTYGSDPASANILSRKSYVDAGDSAVTAAAAAAYPTKAGVGATGTWGISISGSAASTTGNAATATALQTARTINGTSFNGTANITVTAAAGTLTGSALASGVTSSSLTSFGSGIALGTPASGNLANCTFPTLNQSTTGNAATATAANTLSTISGVVIGSSDVSFIAGDTLIKFVGTTYGTGYNGTTGRFTASVAGVYKIDVMINAVVNSGGSCRIKVIHNNTTTILSSLSTPAGGGNMSISRLFTLAVNDYLEVYVESNLAGYIPGDSGVNIKYASKTFLRVA